MKKSSIISWCMLFVVFFCAPHIIYLSIGKNSNVENYENRQLTERPKFEFSSIEVFPDKFENYYNDSLPFRTQLIEMNSLFNYYCFKESPVSKVIIGKNDWLFYNPMGTDGDPIGDINGNNFYTNEELLALKEHLMSVKEELSSQGKEFVIMIIPNKESMYGKQYLTSRYQVDCEKTKGDQVVEYLTSNTDIRIVYPKQEFTQFIEKYPEKYLYWNTDTHWNNLGAYIGSKCLLEELGFQVPNLEQESIIYHEGSNAGDLATMMGLSKYLTEKCDYDVNLHTDSNVSTLVQDFNTECRYTSESDNNIKLFLIRDSFGKSLVPYITPYFTETYLTHSNYFYPELIQKEEPDIVVYEAAERYIDNLFVFNVK